jgi:cytochrome c oxidase assembly protein subunit 15
LEARRLPFAFSSAAWVHSVAATLFVGLVVGMLFTIWRTSAPPPLQLGVRRLVVISLVQAAIGVTQYLTHVPAVLVELHIAGATSLCIGVTQFHLRQSAHDREPSIPRKKPVATRVS